MTKRPNSILSSAGFYAVLFLCLIAVGAGSYFLLFRDIPTAEEPSSSAGQEVVAQAPEVPAVPVETGGSAAIPADTQPPEESESTPAEMPEETVPPKDTTPVVATAPSLIVSPLNGQVVAAFSVDALAYNQTLDDWRTHDGIDIAAAAGTNVLAASAGTVDAVFDDDLLGTTVVLSHSGGYRTTYANLQTKPTVSEGDPVSAGQVIGAVGVTSITESAEGPHLHFSVTKDGDVVDPSDYLAR